MKNTKKCQKKKVKKALKTLNFWYKVLLETEYMDDMQNRLEFQEALRSIENLK